MEKSQIFNLTLQNQQLQMFNSQSQEVLTKYFLLLLQNQRLQRVMINTQSTNINLQKNDSYVNDRISHIEITMGLELKQKQQKIHQLNSYIKQLQGSNQQILKQYERLCKQYKQVNDKLKQNKNQLPNTQIFTQTFEQQQYHIQLIQKQKIQLQQQIHRLTNVTIKQLQADIELLNKESQSYILSINNYRIQQNKYKNQKNKYEEQIKKFNQILKVKQVQKVKCQQQLNEKHEKQMKQSDKKLKKEVQKIVKNYSHQTKSVKQQNLQLQHKYNQLLKTYNKNVQDLQRKSKKLKQYDEQYDIYVNKMNEFSIQTQQFKQQSMKLKQQYIKLQQQNTKLKQQYEIRLKNDKQKYGVSLSKLMVQTKKEKQRIIAEFSSKIQQIEETKLKQKTQASNLFKKQTKLLMQQKQNIQKQFEEKLTKVTTQKQNTIKQWEQLLHQMQTQKNIMALLQKQLSQYRKVNTLNAISQSQNQKNNKVNSINIQLEKQINVQLKVSDLTQLQTKQNKFKQQNPKLVKVQGQKNIRSNYQIQDQSPFNKIYRYYTSESQQEQLTKENNKERRSISSINKNRENQNICCQQCQQSHRSKSKTNTNYLAEPQTGRRSEIQRESDFTKYQNSAQNRLERYRSNSLRDLKRSQQLQTNFSTRPNTHMRGSFGPINSIQTYSYQTSKQQTSREPTSREQTSRNKFNEINRKKSNQTIKKYQYIKNQSQQRLNLNYHNIISQQKPKSLFKDLVQYKSVQKNDERKQVKPSAIQLQLLTNKTKERTINRTYYSLEKQQPNHTFEKGQIKREQKLIRSSSLNKINYDSHLNEIQKYLSFDIIKMKQQKQKGMIKSASDRKLPTNAPLHYERIKTHGFETDEKQQRDILIQKINKIQSYRGSQNQAKMPNFYKRPMNQAPNRMLSMGAKMMDKNMKSDKENLNEIIYRKCQYISQK